jgi:predicted nucleic acid-binding protein
MGLILDTSILIAGERRGETVKKVIQRVRAAFGDAEAALSAVSIVEISHGIYRARTELDRERRISFCEELCRDMIVHPISLEIAWLAGKIEGEQAAKGIAIAFEDLMIGATALHFRFDVATLNVKHFKLIPSLKIVTL